VLFLIVELARLGADAWPELGGFCMSERYVSELKPTWREIAEQPPPLGTKALFKSWYGGAVVGMWYEGCDFVFWAPLPSFTPEQKMKIRERDNNEVGDGRKV
jgi:hypothetical protein